MKKNHNLKWLFVIALAMSMILAACGSGGSDTKDKDSSTGKEPVEGGDLIIAVLSDASSLDPAGSNDVPSSIVQANIFETLVNRDDDNNIIPGLAESGNQSMRKRMNLLYVKASSSMTANHLLRTL